MSMLRKLTCSLMIAFVGACTWVASASAIPAFGPTAKFQAAFAADYPEPRICVSSQEWWLEGAGDVTTSIEDAMRASHQHYEACFPFMETWNEASGSLKMDLQVQAHMYQGGSILNVNALGFLDNSTIKYVFNPVWKPVLDNELRNVTLTRATSTIKRCGRVESRNHVEGKSPNGGERQFSSTGWQSIFTCKAGRTNSSDRGPGIIFRGWYQGADYCNITFSDDFRGETGFRAGQQAAPVIGDLKLKIATGSCTNSKWMVNVNPDIHGGSYGIFHVAGTGSGTTITIPNSVIPKNEVFYVQAVAAERIGTSSANPVGGQNAGVGVIPFLGDSE
jgi:hypothetical protein